MAYRQLSSDCKDGLTCPSVWHDQDADPGYVVVVGPLLDPSPVPLAAGEAAVRLKVRTVLDANLDG